MKKYIIIMAKDRAAIRRIEVMDHKKLWKPGDTYWIENKDWIVGTDPINAKEADTIFQAVLDAIKEEWELELRKPVKGMSLGDAFRWLDDETKKSKSKKP